MSCGNNYCYITGKNKGMATQGPCHCLRPLPIKDQIELKRRFYGLEKELKSLQHQLAAEQEKNARLVDALDMIPDFFVLLSELKMDIKTMVWVSENENPLNPEYLSNVSKKILIFEDMFKAKALELAKGENNDLPHS